MIEHEKLNDKRKERQKRKRDRELSDIREVLLKPEGRRFIWRLLSEAGVFRGSFTGNSETFFKEGQRDIGLLVLRDCMEAKPDSFSQMQREYTSELKVEKLKREKEEEELKKED